MRACLWAVGLLACSSAPAPTPFRGAAFPYEADVPAGATVLVDTTARAELRWEQDTLRLELADVPSAIPPGFDVACGSHTCTASLVEVHGAVRCTYLVEHGTDALAPEPTEAELRARLAPIAASLRLRP